MKNNLAERFFENRDETGRFMVISNVTGVRYCVEPIGDGRGGDWGSYNPGTGNIEHKKGDGKYTGSILAKDSLITEENGFKNIGIAEDNTESVLSEIARRDAIHEANGVRPVIKSEEI